MRKWQGLLLGLVVSAATLYLALRSVNLADAMRALESADYIWVLPVAATSVLGLFTRAIRWRVLLSGRLPLPRSFSILNISYILNNILPARLGDLTRAFLATRVAPPVPVFTSLSTIVAERMIDMLLVLLLLAGVLLAVPNMPPGVMGAGAAMGAAAAAALVALIVFARRPAWAHALLAFVLRLAPPLARFNLRDVLDRALDGLEPLAHWRRFLVVMGWTVISWAFSVLSGYILLHTMFTPPRLDAAVLFVAAASLAIAVPATFASVGPFEWSVIISLVAVYGVSWPALPTTFVMTPLAQQIDLVVELNMIQAKAFSFALVLHALNIAVYAAMGAIGLVQEGVTLGQVTRGARRLGVEPPLDSASPTKAGD